MKARNILTGLALIAFAILTIAAAIALPSTVNVAVTCEDALTGQQISDCLVNGQATGYGAPSFSLNFDTLQTVNITASGYENITKTIFTDSTAAMCTGINCTSTTGNITTYCTQSLDGYSNQRYVCDAFDNSTGERMPPYSFYNAGNAHYQIYLEQNSSVNAPPRIEWNARPRVAENDSTQMLLDVWPLVEDDETPDSNLTFTLTEQSAPTLIDCTLQNNRYLECTPQAPDRIGYSIVFIDVSDGTNTARLDTIIDVYNVNDDPFLVSPTTTFTLNEDTPKNIVLYNYLRDPDGASTYQITDVGANITANFTGNVTYKLFGVGNRINTPVMTISPDTDWFGNTTIQITVTDIYNNVVVQNYTVVVNPVNDIPRVESNAPTELNITEDVFAQFDLNNFFEDIEGDTITYNLTIPDTRSTFTINYSLETGFNAISLPSAVQATTASDVLGILNANGASCNALYNYDGASYQVNLLSFPNLNNFENVPGKGYLIQCDADAIVSLAVKTPSFINTVVNPTALVGPLPQFVGNPIGDYLVSCTTPSVFTVNTDGSYTNIPTSTLIADGEAYFVDCQSSGRFTGGNIAVSPGPLTNFNVVLDPLTGILNVTPLTNTSQTVLSEEIYVTASDDGFTQFASQNVTFTLNLIPVNNAPFEITPIPNVIATEDNTTDTGLSMATYFDDIDNPLSELIFDFTSNETDVNVTANATTNMLVITTGNFTGIAQIDVTVYDGEFTVPGTSFNVTVTNTNDAPITTGIPFGPFNIAEEQAQITLPFNISTLFTDIDAGDILTYTVFINHTDVDVDINTPDFVDIDGSTAYDFFGTLELTVTATDIAGESVNETAVVTVTNINDIPDFNGPILDQTWMEDTTVTINLSQYFTDVDQDVLTYTETENSVEFTFDFVGDELTITPNLGFIGTATATIRADDSALTVDSNSFQLTVVPKSTFVNSWVDGTLYNGNFINVSQVYNSTLTDSNVTDALSTVDDSTLTNVTLTDSTADNSILTNVTATNCIFSNTNVSNTNCADTDMTDATGSGWDVDPSDTTGSACLGGTCTVTDSNVTYSNITDSTIVDSDITLSTITNSTLTDVTATGAIFDNSTVTNSTFTDSNATDSTLTNVTATDSNITNSTLSDAILVDAIIADGVLIAGQLTFDGLITNAGTIPTNTPVNLTELVNYGPTAVITLGATSITEGSAVTIDSASTDPNIPGALNDTLQYTWDFGNGQNSTTATNSITYPTAGTYTINLTVTDNYGETSTTSTTIDVTTPPPAPSNGGGSGGGGGGSSRASGSRTAKTFTVEPTEEGITLVAVKGDRYNFVYEGTRYTLTINDVLTSKVHLTMSPDTVATVEKGFTARFDLAGGLRFDAFVTLQSISRGDATLLFSVIPLPQEETVEDTEEEQPVDDIDTELPPEEDVPQEEGNFLTGKVAAFKETLQKIAWKQTTQALAAVLIVLGAAALIHFRKK
jgi:uncharacterized protein YjbI with pentapeptide repeats